MKKKGNEIILFILIFALNICTIYAQNSYKSCADSIAYFPGGNNQLDLFIKKNLIWPNSEVDVYGKVIVSFLVDSTGIISDIRIERSLFNVFDNEAIRIVKLMPKWIPAKVFNIRVRSIIYLPIDFKIKE